MMTSRITSEVAVLITAGQKKQYDRFIADAADKALIAASIDRDGLQQLIERGGEFQEHIIRGIGEFSTNNQFAGEQIESSFGYAPDYKLGDIDTQIKMLRKIFPDIGRPNQGLLRQSKEGRMELPAGAEGWFAIPHWSKVANTYSKAVEIVRSLLNQAYNGRFNKYLQDQLGPQYLLETSKKLRAMEMLKQSQNEDILLIPAQFGVRHRGRSVRRACAVMNSCEFGLGIYEIGIMLLTHLNRLKHHNVLRIDCAGDEYRPDADSNLPCVLQFDFAGNWLGISYRPPRSVNIHHGSVSGFIWQ
jgi:hypothetical protein